MARGPDFDDPVAAIRSLLRDLRAAQRLVDSPVAHVLCPGVPVADRQGVILNTIRIALHRLPARQQEVLRRYDIAGERASTVQRELALSPRQFFRDRRAALARLTELLLGGAPPQPRGVRRSRRTVRSQRGSRSARASPAAPAPVQPRAQITTYDLELGARTLARSLAQSASTECLRVLWELVRSAHDPASRAVALADLADGCMEFDEFDLARRAVDAAHRIVTDEDELDDPLVGYVSGRLERIGARLAGSRDGATACFARALGFLRRCVDAGGRLGDARWALAETLGDLALFHFADGTFADSRAASAEACEIVTEFELWSRPRALELLAMDATLSACFSGKTAEAVATTTRLLGRAYDSGWCATAAHLGANIVGLNGIRGDYEEAIRWYHRLTAVPGGARPIDRSNMAREAAHAYTMLRRPGEALKILAEVEPGNDRRNADGAAWHAYMSAALERAGDDRAALAAAHRALAGFSAHDAARGVGDAHRLIAISAWKLSDLRTAMEHIVEAQRLVEAHGTPYGLLRTLVAKASIVGSPALRKEAIELARLLLELSKDENVCAPAALTAQMTTGSR